MDALSTYHFGREVDWLEHLILFLCPLLNDWSPLKELLPSIIRNSNDVISCTKVESIFRFLACWAWVLIFELAHQFIHLFHKFFVLQHLFHFIFHLFKIPTSFLTTRAFLRSFKFLLFLLLLILI